MIGILYISGRRYDGECFVVYLENLYDCNIDDFVLKYVREGCTGIRIRII